MSEGTLSEVPLPDHGQRSATTNLAITPQGRDRSDRAPADGGVSNQLALPTLSTDTYEIGDEAGRGGLGRVSRARDRRLDRVVALKQLLRQDPGSQKRFLREVRLTAKLQHPGIVPIHEAARWQSGEPFYAMKLVEGRTLKEVIGDTRSFAERLAFLPHVIAVAEAIGYAHSKGIIHRDLKPSNIVVGEFGEVVVVDWGLAKDLRASEDADVPDAGPYRHPLVDPTTTAAGTILGTPAYMAPEQARGEPVDERADVYAIGALLYHVLTGRPPYEASSSKHIVAELLARAPAAIHEHVPHIPSDLAAIISRAMAREAATRYRDGGALADDLRRFQTGQLVSAHRYSAAALARRWARRHRGLVVSACAALLIVAATAGISVSRIVVARNEARRLQGIAETRALALDRAGREALQRAHQLILANARAALRSDPTETIGWLRQYPVDSGSADRVRDLAVDAASRGIARSVLQGYGGPVTELALSPDSRHVAAAGNGRLRVWETASGKLVIEATAADVTSIAYSIDGKIAFAAPDLSVVILDPANGERSKLSGPSNYTTISPSHPTAVTWLPADPMAFASGTATTDALVSFADIRGRSTTSNFPLTAPRWPRRATISPSACGA